MNISIIVALSSNNVIGKNNAIPWKIPEDRKWFKLNTINKPVIMGYNTWKSIRCKPLLKRVNLIITQKKITIKNKNVIFVNSIQKAIKIVKNEKEIMIIGGESIYRQTLNQAYRLYITYINIHVRDGDRFFPDYKKDTWKIIFQKFYKSNQYQKYDYTFKILERI